MTEFFQTTFTFAQLLTLGRKLRDLQPDEPRKLRFNLYDLRANSLLLEASGQDQPAENYRLLIDDPSLRRAWVSRNLEIYEEVHGEEWSKGNKGPPPQGAFNQRGEFLEVLGQLVKANVGGWTRDERTGEEPPRGVFFNVHQTDGRGAWAENITRGRALFVDDDEGKLNLRSIRKLLPPTAVIRSKRGCHLYWALSETLSVEKIVYYQHALAARLGTDAAVVDAARVMRVPGFKHWKDGNDPFKVVCEFVDPSLKYTKAQIVEGFNLNIKAAKRAKEKTAGSSSRGEAGTVEIPNEIASRPGRIEAFIKRVESRPHGLSDGRKRAAMNLGSFAGDYGVTMVEAFPIVKAWDEKNSPPLDDDALLRYQMYCGYRTRKSPIGDRLKPLPPPPGEKQKIEIPESEHFDETLVIPPDENTLEFLEGLELEDRTHVVLCTPQGSGKTEYGKTLVSRAESSLVVTPRTSLTANMSSRYGIANYQNTKAADNIATTVHSLHKIYFDNMRKQETGFERDIYIVDEADKVLDAITEKTNDHPAKLLSELFNRSAHSRNSLWMSADMTEEYADYISSLLKRNDPGCKIIFVFQASNKKLKVRNIGIPACKVEFLEACQVKDPDAPAIVAFTTSKDKPFKLKAAILKLNPGLRVLVVTGKNAHEPEIQKLLSEPDRMITEYDVLIASPTIGIGINIVEPVSEVYVFHTLRNIPGADVAQMMGRCRNILSGEVVYGCNKFKQKFVPTTDEYLHQLVIGYAKVTDNVILSLVDRDLLEGRNQITDPDLFNCWKLKKRRAMDADNNPQGDLYKHICRHRWEYDNSSEESVSSEGKKLLAVSKYAEEEDAEFRRQEHARKTAEAEDLAQEDAERIAVQYQKTEDEFLGLEKFRITNFYEKEVDEALVLLDDEGDYRKKIDRYVRASILAQEPDGLLTLAKLEHVDTNNKHAVQYRNKLLQAMTKEDLYREILGAPFGSPENDTALVRSTPEIRKKIVALVQDKKRSRIFRELLGKELHDESKAFTFFNTMARADGVEVRMHECVSSSTGEKQRVYIYNTARIRELAQPHRKRLLDRSKRAKSDVEWMGFLDEINGGRKRRL